jgi:hypothetical protein
LIRIPEDPGLFGMFAPPFLHSTGRHSLDRLAFFSFAVGASRLLQALQ